MDQIHVCSMTHWRERLGESTVLNPTVSDLMVLAVTSKHLLEKMTVSWCFTSFLLISNPPSLLPSHSSRFWCTGSNRRHSRQEESMCFLCYSAGCCATTPSTVAYGMFSVHLRCHVSRSSERLSRYSLGCENSKLPFRFHKFDLGYFHSMNLDSWKTFTFSCCLVVRNKQNTPLFLLSVAFNKIHKDSLWILEQLMVY